MTFVSPLFALSFDAPIKLRARSLLARIGYVLLNFSDQAWRSAQTSKATMQSVATAICALASLLPANQEKRAESSRLNPGRTDAPESVPSRLMTSLWTSPSAPSWQTSTLFLLGLTIQTSRVPFLQIDCRNFSSNPVASGCRMMQNFDCHDPAFRAHPYFLASGYCTRALYSSESSALVTEAHVHAIIAGGMIAGIARSPNA